MATQKTNEAAAAAGGSGALKTMIIVGGVLALEAATILGTVYFSGSPKSAMGDDAIASSQTDEMDRPVEIQLISKKFFNQRSGRSYYYDAEIYVTTPKKYEAEVTEQIAGSQAALTEEIGTLVRQAEHSVFLEPTYTTLKRKLKALMDKRFGNDADGEPIIGQVLIQKCIPYPADM